MSSFFTGLHTTSLRVARRIIDSKSSQTDEEKQRERQRNEREQKNAEQEAINYKRDRDAREARLLDFEIRRAHEKDRKKEIEKQQILKQQHQHHKQQSLSEKSTPSSAGTYLSDTRSPRDPSDRAFPRSRTKSIEQDEKTPATSPDRIANFEASEIKDYSSTTPSLQTTTGLQSSHSVVAGPPATAAAATAAIIPILPLGVAALRDDSTESDQSLTYSQSDAYHRIFVRPALFWNPQAGQ